MDVKDAAAANPRENQSRINRNDGTKLLYQPGYIKVIKQFALSGELVKFGVRSVCWKLFLGCLPEQHDQWIETTHKNRHLYDNLMKKHLLDPHNLSLSLDVAINNPLSQDSDSPWHKYFLDGELKQSINQDITRTFPDVQFFRQQSIQDTMLQILFCYAKEHPDIEYRQGMHELLAPILYVLHMEKHDEGTLSPEMKVVVDPAYIEHDAYCIFSELMEIVQSWYTQSQAELNYQAMLAPRGSKPMIHDPRNHKPFEEKIDQAPTSPINRKLEYIHEVLLKKSDLILYTHLKALSIPMQAYGIRWLRLLYSREFSFTSLLDLWDALFADRTLIDYFFVVMLVNIRESLLSNDYTTAMQALMTYPYVENVNYLVQKTLNLKNPQQFPVTILDRDPEAPVMYSAPPSSLSIVTPSPPPPAQEVSTPSPTTKGNKGTSGLLHAIATSTKAHLRPKTDHHSGTQATHEMIPNFKNKPPAEEVSDDSLEAKCNYCGQKMDAIVAIMQDEVIRLTSLSKEGEQNMLVSLAGLKQIRDLLQNKIPFSSDLCNWATEKAAFSSTIFVRSSADPQVSQEGHRPLEQQEGTAHSTSKEDVAHDSPVRNDAHSGSSGSSGEVARSSSEGWCEVESHALNA